MTEHDKADEARKGLLDSIKGKAKEVVGAVSGNESLTAEGQLEQTQARERKEANGVQAVADAEAQQARDDAAAAKVAGAKESAAVNAETASAERAAAAQRDARKRAAEQAGAQEAVAEGAKAEAEARRNVQEAKVQEQVDVRAAADDVLDATEEHDQADRIAANAHAEADRIRARANGLATDAKLP